MCLSCCASIRKSNCLFLKGNSGPNKPARIKCFREVVFLRKYMFQQELIVLTISYILYNKIQRKIQILKLTIVQSK